MQFQGIGDLVVCVGKVVLSGDGWMHDVCIYLYLYRTSSKDEDGFVTALRCHQTWGRLNSRIWTARMHLFSLMKGPERLSATHRRNPELGYKDDWALALLSEKPLKLSNLSTWQ